MRILRQLALTSVLLTLAAAPAWADGFITPFVGLNFGGDSGCPGLTELGSCTNKHLNVGVSLGSMGKVFGFEEDISYAKNFFGEGGGTDSSVFSAMSNLLVGVGVGPVQPYFVGGFGVIRPHVASTVGSAFNFSDDKTAFGYDVGGGINGYFSDHVGIRGDIRLLHTMQEIDFAIFDAAQRVNFWRASLGLALKF